MVRPRQRRRHKADIPRCLPTCRFRWQSGQGRCARRQRLA